MLNIISKLGEGAFANVFLAKMVDGREVAVKIPKDNVTKENACKYAKYEVALLKEFSQSKYIVNLIDYEITNETNYIMIELLGDELYTLINHYNDNHHKIPIGVIKNIIKQILQGLIELSDQNMLHNDMKLENVLFVEPLRPIFKQSYKRFTCALNDIVSASYQQIPKAKRVFKKLTIFKKHYKTFLSNNYHVLQEVLLINARVKISDFGNAYSEELTILEPKYFKYSRPTRHYISPEILLGAPFWKESDMWSIGCMVYELLTGKVMFRPYRDNNMGANSMHIATMIKIFGRFPKRLIKRGVYSKKYFIGTKYRLNYLIPKNKKLSDLLAYYGVNDNEIPKIIEFLDPIFKLDPKKRITPYDCLKSSWLLKQTC